MATLQVPFRVPSPFEDAEILNKALKGWTADKNAVIEILAHRTADQRREIMSSYKMLYKESLTKRLDSKLSGNLKKAVLPWMLDPNDRQAALVSLAVKEDNPVNYRVIIEIACINSPDELLAVKKAYQARNEHRSLEEDVAFHTDGDLHELLFSLLHADRFDGKEANLKLASTEAKILHDDIKGKGFNHAEIIKILSTRSKAQLRATFSRYKIDYGTSITKDLNRKPPSEFIDALKITIRCIDCPQKYFAKVLHNAISNGECILDAFNEGERVTSCIKVFDTGKSVGDGDNLTRVFVTRAEKDLNEIKQMFEQRTNTTLRYAVTKKASGNYQRFLLALLGTD